jgi:hypothetical protein
LFWPVALKISNVSASGSISSPGGRYPAVRQITISLQSTVLCSRAR